ncbi:hypothetical protein [Cellulophaga sp. L1A9]|uniref:hypothetical protein n=1 Tax=Cellulophaga sp. L1A9 TaxID=2686362 RepID=UPI00131B41D8|nr:hypothetical protein [Cellulophaga sp. L1A9]
MDLLTYCTACKRDIKIKSNAETRPDLQMEKGDTFQVNCNNCGTSEKKHVNDVRAEKSNLIILIGAGIGLLVTILLSVYLGLIGTIGLVIPFLFWKQQTGTTKSFNGYMVRRK